MNFIRNARIAVKLSLFAGLAIVMLVALSLVGYAGLKRQTLAMQDLYEKRFSSVAGVAKASDLILGAHADIYKVVNLVNLRKPESQIDEEIAKFLKKLDEARSQLRTLANLENTKSSPEDLDAQKLRKQIEAKLAIIDQVQSELNQRSGSTEAEDRTVALTELISLAIDAYQVAITGVMPTVKLMDMIGPEVAAGMMEGTETDFLLIGKGLETLRSYNQARAQMAYQTSIESEEEANSVFILIGGLSILLLSVFAFIIVRSISVPLKQTVMMLKELGKGRLQNRLNLNRRDEIGEMAQTLDSFANSLQQDMVVPLQKLAEGDLTFQVTPHDHQDEVRTALQKVGADLNEIVRQVQTAGLQIDAASDQVSESSQTLSHGATETAASLEEISSSMNQIASQSNHSAENAKNADTLTTETRKAADEGACQMDAMTAAMEEINAAGQDISKIIKVIDEIAFQTNLLALNAAVEAARAGQHGKGFAVVAEEVRNLAARSAKAARETTQLIEESVAKANNGTQIAEATSSALKRIVDSVEQVSDLVSEIATANQEQALGISQINQGLGQIDESVQRNTATSEESAAAAEELSSQATYLKQILSGFKLSA